MSLKTARVWRIDVVFTPLLFPYELVLQIHYLHLKCNGALQPRFWDLDVVEKSTELQISYVL